MNKTTKSKTSETSSKEIKLGGVVIKTVLKTLWLTAFILGFVIVGMSVLTPRIMLKSFDAMGLNRAGYLVQKRLYERDDSNENLFNLIQRAIEDERYKDQVKYIQIIMANDDYSEFCDAVDKETRQVLGQRYSIYADSYDTYLRRHLVEALYKTGETMEAKMMAIDSVYMGLDELYMYVSLIINDDELLDMQKSTEITTLYTRYSITTAIETKQLELSELLDLTESNYDAVIILEQKIKLAEIQQVLGKYAGNATLENGATANIAEWTRRVARLANEL